VPTVAGRDTKYKVKIFFFKNRIIPFRNMQLLPADRIHILLNKYKPVLENNCLPIKFGSCAAAIFWRKPEEKIIL
jgi:hypothetical protein